jgi:acetyl coenzyme A synthetase (ADP forming)-like protein
MRRVVFWLLFAVAAVWALIVAATRQFQHRIDGEARALLAAAGGSAAPVEARELEELPPPVRRWLEVSGTVGRPRATTVRLRQRGEMRTGPDKPWMPVAAEQYFSVEPPGFVWGVNARMMGVLPIAGRDRYVDGHGNMLIKVGALFTVADGIGPEIDQGAMLRYLGEIVWFPSAALSDSIAWEAIDERSARATMRYAGVTVTAVFAFDERGRLASLTADRYMSAPGGPRLEKWAIPITAWRTIRGIEMPVRGNAVWKLAAGGLRLLPLGDPGRGGQPPCAVRRRAGPAGGGCPMKTDTGLAHDVFRRARHPLDPFFKPRSVAVIGATETPGSVGRTVLANLVATSFGGAVHPVNPRRETVLGLKSYPAVGDVPGQVDLAVVVTPAATVPVIIRQCVDAHVPAALIISAGFRETGPVGAELEARVFAEARRGGMRLVGPNCLGVMSPTSGLNATFAAGIARPGRVAFLSQSGALLTAILDWSFAENVGFSAFVSTGSMLDVGWGDLIDYFGDDPATRAIVIYMESIGDARAFLSAAREVALTKPIIVIKAGRSEAASRAATSHTGALTGSDDVLDAAFRRAGVLRVNAIEEVFDLAELLGKQPRPMGRRLTIVTNAGGPGVLATDALVAGGGELAELSADSRGRLGAVLPAAWSHGNPIDVLGDATPDRYEQALAIAAADPASDGLLVILTPQDMTDPTRTAEALTRYAHVEGKPVLASWMGGERVAAGVDALNRAGIPTFAFPDDAARAFCDMGRFADNLRALYETPVPRTGDDGHPAEVDAIIDGACAGGQDAARRGGSEGGARRVRHPGRADAHGPRQGRSRRGGARHGLPGRGEAVVAHHHAQDRRRRRQARAGGRGRGGARIR